MAEITAGGFILLAIIILAALIGALVLLNKLGFFTPSDEAIAETVVTVTWEQLMEEVEQKKVEWANLIDVFESTTTLPNAEECDTLKAVRDIVAQKINEAANLGAPQSVIATATDGLAEMNNWLDAWQCN